mmetsp:Transcript_109048/g.260171  ORF Transcript_109048/g.260171 Transcript_109048/m.260171 type:complete len:342 (+) Transcript_109048:2172-3197(+)
MGLAPGVHCEHLEGLANGVLCELAAEALARKGLVPHKHLDQLDDLHEEEALLADAHAYGGQVVQQPAHLLEVELLRRGFQDVAHALQALHPHVEVRTGHQPRGGADQQPLSPRRVQQVRDRLQGGAGLFPLRHLAEELDQLHDAQDRPVHHRVLELPNLRHHLPPLALLIWVLGVVQLLEPFAAGVQGVLKLALTPELHVLVVGHTLHMRPTDIGQKDGSLAELHDDLHQQALHHVALEKHIYGLIGDGEQEGVGVGGIGRHLQEHIKDIQAVLCFNLRHGLVADLLRAAVHHGVQHPDQLRDERNVVRSHLAEPWDRHRRASLLQPPSCTRPAMGVQLVL